MRKLSVFILFLISTYLFAQQVELFDGPLNEFQNVRDFCIAKTNDEAYFSIQSPNQDLSHIVVMKKINNEWTDPVLMPFCDEFMYLEPFLTSDGKRLFFVSNRPLNDIEQVKKDFDIWYVQRDDVHKQWSNPINLGSSVNSNYDEFYPTLSENNNLYFTMVSPSGIGNDDIYFCEWNGMEYSKPQMLNKIINSAGYEFNAFISKDESFLIYTKYNADDGYGSGDLYISRKDSLGEWQEAINLGNVINTKHMEYCPYYDSANEILYFTSRQNSLTPKKFNTLTEFNAYISSGENGLSKIYKYHIKLE